MQQPNNVTPIDAARGGTPEWFGLEVFDKDGPRKWVRIELFAEGDSRPVRFWPCARRDPREVAKERGPGRYRVVWLAGERKTRCVSRDAPFDVLASGEATPAPVAAAPPASVPGAVPPQLRRVAELGRGVLPEGSAVDAQTASFVLVHGLSMQSTTALLENMRLAYQQSAQQQQAFFAAMLEQQRNGAASDRAMLMQVLGIERSANERATAAEIRAVQASQPRQDAVAAELEALRALIAAGREDDEEDEDEDEEQERPTITDPTQLERAALAVGTLLEGAHKLGLGPVIQRFVSQKLGVDAADVAAAAAAAE